MLCLGKQIYVWVEKNLSQETLEKSGLWWNVPAIHFKICHVFGIRKSTLLFILCYFNSFPNAYIGFSYSRNKSFTGTFHISRSIFFWRVFYMIHTRPNRPVRKLQSHFFFNSDSSNIYVGRQVGSEKRFFRCCERSQCIFLGNNFGTKDERLSTHSQKNS